MKMLTCPVCSSELVCKVRDYDIHERTFTYRFRDDLPEYDKISQRIFTERLSSEGDYKTEESLFCKNCKWRITDKEREEFSAKMGREFTATEMYLHFYPEHTKEIP